MSLHATRALTLVTTALLAVTLPVALAAAAPARLDPRSADQVSSPEASPTRVLHAVTERRDPPRPAAPVDDVPIEIIDALVIERAVPTDVIPDLPDEVIGYTPAPSGNTGAD